MFVLQGPILSANKKLVAEKLAEEEAERKVKGEAKKEKQLVFPTMFVYGLACFKLADSKCLDIVDGRKRACEACYLLGFS